nr:hypothetical protein [Kovacikia minuta]
MRVWITCFLFLFGATELLQWFKQFSLPLPIFILGGVFLAIVSNYDKLTSLPSPPNYEEPEISESDVFPIQPAQTPQPANFKKKPLNSVSFEIRKPFRPGD